MSRRRHITGRSSDDPECTGVNRRALAVMIVLELHRTFNVVFVFTCFTNVSANDLSNYTGCS